MCIEKLLKGAVYMNSGETRLIKLCKDDQADPREIINSVFKALKEKGYNPISQFVGYLLSGDPTYITSYNNSRVMISSLERDEILEELIKAYLNQNNLDI